MKMYFAGFGNVKEVDVERKTAAFVYHSNGKRDAIKTTYTAYLDSYDEAVNWLIMKEKDAVISARKNLEFAEARYNRLIQNFSVKESHD